MRFQQGIDPFDSVAGTIGLQAMLVMLHGGTGRVCWGSWGGRWIETRCSIAMHALNDLPLDIWRLAFDVYRLSFVVCRLSFVVLSYPQIRVCIVACRGQRCRAVIDMDQSMRALSA